MFIAHNVEADRDWETHREININKMKCNIWCGSWPIMSGSQLNEWIKKLWYVYTMEYWCRSQPMAGPVCCGSNGQIQTDYQVLWRKRDSRGLNCTVTLSRGQRPTLTLTGFYCFSGHITLRMVLIYYAQVHFRWLPLQKTKERMLLITSKRKDIYKCKGKSSWTGYTPPWEV